MTTTVADYLALYRSLTDTPLAPGVRVWSEDRARYLAVPCPQPRCPARVGEDCRTPNGWLTGHNARRRAARGEAPAKPQRHRLTDAQAERIEFAAEFGRYIAPAQFAYFGGDAAERAVADALVKHGLVEQAGTTGAGERVLRLTSQGWRTYWHHRLVIRRLPVDRHAGTCPCEGKEALR